MTPARFSSLSAMLPVLFLLVFQPLSHAAPGTLAEELCEAYRKIESISCEIRKITESPENTVRMLSRVHYKKPGKIHVESVSPVSKRIISDGTRLYYYQENAERGFSRPVTELEEPMLSAYKNIPATPVEHLIKLKKYREESLGPTDEFPLRRAYRTGKAYVVLSADTEKKLHSIEFFASEKMEKRTAFYKYSKFIKARPDCWIPCLHEAVINLPDGREIHEARHIHGLQIGKPIPEELFDHSGFLSDVEFTDDFKKTYEK